MIACVTTTYRETIKTDLPAGKLEKIIGILAVLIMMCNLISICNVEKLFEEEAFGKSYYSKSMAGEENGGMFAAAKLCEEGLKTVSSAGKEFREIELDEYFILPVSEPVLIFEETEDRRDPVEIPAVVSETYEASPAEEVLAPDVILDEAEKEEEPEESFVDHGGFLCDSTGIIVGCDHIPLTDGVLCFPADEFCTGIKAGALASLGEEVLEVYIPANIIWIDEGVFDGLPGLMYIEVHPDNPRYGSLGGILFEK